MSAALHLAEATIGNEPEPALIEVRPKDGRSEFFSVTTPERAVDCALRRSVQRETFWGMAPRRPLLKDGRQFGGAEAILRGHLLSADCDSDAALDALAIFDPPPSFVVASGGFTDEGRPKVHPHWALSKPVPRAALCSGKRRLADVLGSDTKICDAARVMRLPGMVTHKYGTPRVCESVEDHPELVYSFAEVMANAPELPSVAVGARARRETSDASRDDIVRQKQEKIAPPDYVRDLAGIEVGADGKCFCPFHDDGEKPSFHAYPTAEQGWFCYGDCQTGGDIYTFAALLRGIRQRDLHGATYQRIWRQLRLHYGLAVDT